MPCADLISTPIPVKIDRLQAEHAQPDSDGYTPGQRDRALVLDFLALSDRTGKSWPEHIARDLTEEEFEVAERALYADGLAAPDGDGFPRITPAGLAAHAGAQRALADLDARIEASQRFAHLDAERRARLGVSCTPEEALADLDAKIAALPPAATGFAPRRDITEV